VSEPSPAQEYGLCPYCLKNDEVRDIDLKGMCRMHYQRERRGRLEDTRSHQPRKPRTGPYAGRPRRQRHYKSKSVGEIAKEQGLELQGWLVPRFETPPAMITHDPAIGIVAHTSRYDYAQGQADKIFAEAISVDDGTVGCEANHRRLWSWLQSSPSRWCLILEDDVILVPAFRFQLNQILARAPRSIISLYLGRGRPPHYQPAILKAITTLPSEDTCFMTGKDLLSAQGYLVPTDFLPTLLENTDDGPVPIDEQISRVAREHKLKVHYTWPSLVDHRDDLEPLITERHDGQRRTEHRVAWRFGGRHTWHHNYHPLKTPEELGMTVIRA
jgi:GR25 family glycosyltransferase involved in LPS biosynthesis